MKSAIWFLRRCGSIALNAFWQFLADEGWAIASHIALSALMSMFPFFIVLTALAAIFGSRELSDEAARLVLEAWPKEVAGPIAAEIHTVLSSDHGPILTVGSVLALYFASSGIESLRIGLNRAYGVTDRRSLILLRLESIVYVVIGAASLLALSFLVVLAPLIWKGLVRYLPGLEPFSGIITFARYAVASALLIGALFVVHLWLPAGRRRLREIFPGIIATVVLWIFAGAMFGRYLADYAFAYSFYYAGLASTMIALIFLYLTASIFIYGGELNATILKSNKEDAAPTAPPQTDRGSVAR
jgi:membrane protein